jgi:parallel beta-helix repeat protein
MNITVTDNAVAFNGNDSIYLEHLNSGSHTYNITLSGNIVSSNGGHGIYIHNDDSDSIFNVSVSGNTVHFNGGHGLFLASDYVTHSVAISSNTFSNNGEHGIFLTGLTIYNTKFSNNTIFSNDYGIRVVGGHHSPLLFDLSIDKNLLSGNSVGSEMPRTAKANMSRNSIGYNTYGVRYVTTSDNLAEFKIFTQTLTG